MSNFAPENNEQRNDYMSTLSHKIASFLLMSGVSYCSFAQDTTEKIWVTFESASSVPESQEGTLHSSNLYVQTLIEEFNITKVEQAVPASSQESLLKVYEVSCNCDADELSKAIRSRSVELINPEAAPEYQLLGTPDDYTTSFQLDYALDLIQAEGAWDYSTGDEATIIGISDANYYQFHEELEAKIDYINPQNASTNYYHGTAVAITAAGHTNNGVGKSAIGYDCKLSLSATGYNNLLQLSNNGIRVINVSWASGCYPSSYIQSIVDEIYDNGSILVIAAGNGSTCGGPSNPVFPAACDHVISVTSVGANDNHERIVGDPNSAHQHHSTVDICAPGYDVALSMAPGNYQYGNGTSFAAPMVSGTIGLMLSLKPCLSFEEVEEILRLSADDLYDLNPSYIGLLGMGRLNAEQALHLTTMNECDGIIINTPPLVVDTTVGVGTIGTSDPTISAGGNGGVNPIIDYNEDIQDKFENQNTTLAGINDEIGLDVIIYPNPTAGSASIQVKVTESMELTVTDVRGRIVDYQLLPTGSENTQIAINESGVYFIQLTQDGKHVWFGKLIKT